MSGFYFSQNAKEGDRIMEIQTIHLYRDTDRDIEPEKDDKFFRATDEYSCVVTPQVRQTGNRLSGLVGTAYASLLA